MNLTLQPKQTVSRILPEGKCEKCKKKALYVYDVLGFVYLHCASCCWNGHRYENGILSIGDKLPVEGMCECGNLESEHLFEGGDDYVPCPKFRQLSRPIISIMPHKEWEHEVYADCHVDETLEDHDFIAVPERYEKKFQEYYEKEALASNFPSWDALAKHYGDKLEKTIRIETEKEVG